MATPPPSPGGGDVEYISSVATTSTLLSVPVLTVLIVPLESGVVL